LAPAQLSKRALAPRWLSRGSEKTLGEIMDPREEANNYVDRHKIMKLFEELGE
jgi:hypothetical protein